MAYCRKFRSIQAGDDDSFEAGEAFSKRDQRREAQALIDLPEWARSLPRTGGRTARGGRLVRLLETTGGPRCGDSRVLSIHLMLTDGASLHGPDYYR